MIKIIYHRDKNRVSIEGHAESGEKGHDLVCASVSILAYTLASFVQNMKEAKQVYNPKTDLREGDALICCEPPSKYKNSVTLVFDSICGGFELLARNYPEYVSFEIRGE
jgi:uncharacterized protein YsxB (DUF464 family)